ncbi:hypothetical protein BM1_08995 [Bipolaris maydis]|nr:hypothetical protein BM1_08995 [Bipolaris maydis]
MTALAKAIAAIDSQDAEGQLLYRAAAKKFGVELTTLTRRHQNKTQSPAAAAAKRQLLTPPQESELVKYIEKLSDRGLPPSRAIIKNYVAVIAEWEPSNSWVTRFLKRHNDVICIRKATGIDRDRHRADNPANYQSYFDLIYDKLDQYSIAPHNIYNMDEKGFLLGRIMPSKRIFSKELWEQKKIRKTLQDGSRDWITIIGCICADGSSVDPTIIYEGTDGLRNEWLRDLEARKHQVFDRLTKEKAKRDYRMLLVDGHGSHLTPSFIDYCDTHRILLAVYPPHATHSLQPLDVGVYSPLALAYSSELANLLQSDQGLLDMRKSDFLRIFWAAYTSAFTANNILSSFQATGIYPRDRDVVMKRFKTPPPRADTDTGFGEAGDGDSWRHLSKLFDAAMPDTSKNAAKQLKQAFHSLQIQNELLHHENEELRGSITTRKHRKSERKLLNLQQHEEYHSTAVVWSPRSVREARAREAAEQQQYHEKKLQKEQQREERAAAAAYKKQMAQAAREHRAAARMVRQQERAARAAQLAAARAQKAEDRAAATAQKSRDKQKTAKRKASSTQNQKVSKRRRVVEAESGGGDASPPAKPPTKTTTRGRSYTPRRAAASELPISLHKHPANTSNSSTVALAIVLPH